MPTDRLHACIFLLTGSEVDTLVRLLPYKYKRQSLEAEASMPFVTFPYWIFPEAD